MTNDIFISYAREDQARIQPLVRVLEGQGWSVFWDRRIPAGKTWHTYIGNALRDARCVIVAWSHAAIASNWVTEEAEVGKQRAVLIPILLDCVEPPFGFRSIQAADLSDGQWELPSQPLEQLLHDIGELLNERHTGLGQGKLEHKILPPKSNPLARILAYGALAALLLTMVAGGLYWAYKSSSPRRATPERIGDHILPERLAPRADEEVSFRSLPGSTSAQIFFINTTRGPVKIYWLDSLGQRKLYFVLGPGESRLQDTFLHHSWLVTDNDDRGIALFISESGIGRAIIR